MNKRQHAAKVGAVTSSKTLTLKHCRSTKPRSLAQWALALCLFSLCVEFEEKQKQIAKSNNKRTKMPAKIIEELVPDYWLMELRNDDANSIQFNPRQGQNSIYIFSTSGDRTKAFKAGFTSYMKTVYWYIYASLPPTQHNDTLAWTVEPDRSTFDSESNVLTVVLPFGKFLDLAGFSFCLCMHLQAKIWNS